MMEVLAELVASEGGSETKGTQYVLVPPGMSKPEDGTTTEQGTTTKYVLLHSEVSETEGGNGTEQGTTTEYVPVHLPPGVSVVATGGGSTTEQGTAAEYVHLPPGMTITEAGDNPEHATEYIHLQPTELQQVQAATYGAPVTAQLPAASFIASTPGTPLPPALFNAEAVNTARENQDSSAQEPMVTDQGETIDQGEADDQEERTTLFYNMYNLPSDLCTVQMLTYSNVGNVPKMKLVTVTDVMNVSITFKCRHCSKTFKSHKLFQDHSKTHRTEGGLAAIRPEVPPKTSSQLEDVLMSIMSGASKSAAGQDGGGDTITAIGDEETPEYVVYRLEGSENSNDMAMSEPKPPMQSPAEEPLDIPAKQCPCYICKKVFDEPLLWGHYLDAHMADTFMCVVCGKKFETENLLVKHMMQIHTDFKVDTPFICPVCEKQFGAHPLLLQHIIRAHPDFKEPVVPEKAAEVGLLKNVVVPSETRPCQECSGTGSITSQKYPCRICRKGFSDWRMLQKHMAAHVERTICTVCHKVVYAKSLAKHMTLHTKAKAYKCPECDGAYRDKCDLKKHMRIHTGEKPYTCEICNRSFAHSNQLPRHLRTHSGEKPFKCLVCEKLFSRKFGLQQHMKKHTAAKELKCSTCELICIDKMALKKHMMTHKRDSKDVKEEKVPV